MSSKFEFSIPKSKLIAQDETGDRFAYQLRFVPLNFVDSSKHNITSVWQKALNALVPSTSGSQFDRTRLKKKESGSGGFSRELGLRSEEESRSLAEASELGTLFLERTRISPAGCAVGDQVCSISLAPGEEVSIEQKSFSERQTSYEESTESGIEKEFEFSSTLTTDLQNSLSNTVSESQTRGFNISANAGGEVAGIKLGVDASFSNTVNESDQTTRQNSSRNAQVNTTKIAAKLRSQHKITFKISETSRFESGTKRTFRNPNTFKPIDLLYFKILQKVSIAHERYGVRLCWAPFVPDPGKPVAILKEQARARFLQKAMADSLLPIEPSRPIPTGKSTPPPVSVIDHELDDWGFFGEMVASYVIHVPMPAGLGWDGNLQSVTDSLQVTTTNLGLRQWWVLINEVKRTTTGIDVTVNGFASAGMAGAHILVSFAVQTVYDATTVDPEHQKALDNWMIAHADWATKMEELKKTAQQSALTAFSAWEAQFDSNLDPVQALMQSFITMAFPSGQRDSFAEVNFWSNVFDFENAVVQLYPGWWLSTQPNDPTKLPTSIENASWARLFLPIRIGYETTALKWIYGRAIKTVPALLNNSIQIVVKELEKFRTDNFGGPNEILEEKPQGNSKCPEIKRPFICLGHWEDLLPTDGTHLEVVHAGTTAMDDISKQAIDDAHDMSQAEAKLRTEQSQAIKEAVKRKDLKVALHVADPNKNA